MITPSDFFRHHYIAMVKPCQYLVFIHVKCYRKGYSSFKCVFRRCRPSIPAMSSTPVIEAALA